MAFRGNKMFDFPFRFNFPLIQGTTHPGALGSPSVKLGPPHPRPSRSRSAS